VNHYSISLRLVNGKDVVPSPNPINPQPGDTLEFSSEAGEVDIDFTPPDAVEIDSNQRFRLVTVKKVPFNFGCRLVFGWPASPDSGGETNPGPPH